jgi:hypothetical protein
LTIFDYFLDHVPREYEFVMVIDDEYCPNPRGLGDLLRNYREKVGRKKNAVTGISDPKSNGDRHGLSKATPASNNSSDSVTTSATAGPPQLYGGVYLFRGTEYRSMAGADGSKAAFHSGHGWILSRGLVEVRDCRLS